MKSVLKKILVDLLMLAVAAIFVACSKDDGKGKVESSKKTKSVYNVAYLVNGNLGDKSFFDSANTGLVKLQKDGRITLRTIEMGGTDSDQPKWLSTLYEVSESKEYDIIVVGTFQMPDFLKEVATAHPDQKYIIFDDNTYVGANKNVLNLMYKQNELGYIIGVLASAVTTETSVPNINPEAVIGFVGGIDSPIINDFLIGYIEGAKSVNPNVKIDTRYTNDYVDTARAKEFGLSMMNDQKVDVIWGVAGNAGNGAAEAILQNKQAWFIGVDSDQELTFSKELSSITLTSGLKNIGNSLIWVFDELDGGRTYWGTEIALGLTDDGVGIVTDKNYKTLPDSVKAKVQTAIDNVKNGSIKLSTALGAQAIDITKIRDNARP